MLVVARGTRTCCVCDRLIAPALRLDADKAGAFAAACNPASANASEFSQGHVTSHGKARNQALELLRALDREYLGGVLKHAEKILEPLTTTVDQRV